MRHKIKKKKKSINFISPDHSPFDSICSIMQQRVYGTLFSNSNELKKRLLEV